MQPGSLVHRELVLGDQRFPYYFGVGVMDRIVSALAAYEPDRFLVVTDDTVLGLHGEPLLLGLERHAPVHVLSAPAGEGMKSLDRLARHLEEAVALGASRRSVVVAFGGGVPGNLGGMVASMLFRGIRLAHIPTTTVAAMDSVISLKQAVNSHRGKNHLGNYHAPEAVYTDVSLLQTLSARELRSGLCEAAKNCLVIRPESVSTLERVLGEDQASIEALLWLLGESLAAKLSVMADDAKERHRGLVLEYGHTVGHAVELCDQRRSGAGGISHGDAIALGMVAAARISEAIGELDPDAVGLHEKIVASLGAPLTVPSGLDLGEVAESIRADSKRGFLALDADEAAMVLLEDLGRPLGPPDRPLVAVSLPVIHEVLEGLVHEKATPITS